MRRAASGDVLSVQTLPGLAAASAKQWASWAREEGPHGRPQRDLSVLAVKQVLDGSIWTCLLLSPRPLHW